MYLSAHEHSGTALFVFVIAFLITYLILTFYNPDFVQRKHHGHASGENDVVTTMIAAFFISIAILFILGVLVYAFSCYY